MKQLNDHKNPKQTFSNAILRGFIRGISRVLSNFNIDFKSFVEQLEKETAIRTHKKNKQIVKTSILTGIERRRVSEIINNKSSFPHSKKVSTEIRILEYISQSARYNKGKVNKKGDLNSLHTILRRAGCSHVSMDTFIEILEDRGAIKDMGDHIMFLGHEYKNKGNDELFIGNISRSIERYTKTIIFNRETADTEQKSLYDRTTYSTQIKPDKHEEIEEEIFQMCREFSREIDLYLASNETAPPGTYDEVGITIYQHNSIKRGNPNE